MTSETLTALSLPLGALLGWLSFALVRSYLSEGWPGHALAGVALGFGSFFVLSLFWRVM